jgi:hypothetical protein
MFDFFFDLFGGFPRFFDFPRLILIQTGRRSDLLRRCKKRNAALSRFISSMFSGGGIACQWRDAILIEQKGNNAMEKSSLGRDGLLYRSLHHFRT